MVSDDQIKHIAKLTIGQHSNEAWLKYRHGRLTASNFGAILRGIQKKGAHPHYLKHYWVFYFIIFSGHTTLEFYYCVTFF